MGNPTAQEVREYQSTHHAEQPLRPVIALLAGSRRQEIKDNLPAMIAATRHLSDRYDIVLAGAPGIEPSYYDRFLRGTAVRMVRNQTYDLLSTATAALVTSGTATLETAMFNVPQVVCYETPLPWLIGYLRRHLLKVRYVSLVNLIADREVVRELVADTFSADNIASELSRLLPDGEYRSLMLAGYGEVMGRIGEDSPSECTAHIIYGLVKKS